MIFPKESQVNDLDEAALLGSSPGFCCAWDHFFPGPDNSFRGGDPPVHLGGGGGTAVSEYRIGDVTKTLPNEEVGSCLGRGTFLPSGRYQMLGKYVNYIYTYVASIL